MPRWPAWSGSGRRRERVPEPENLKSAPGPEPTPVFLTMIWPFLVFVQVQVTVSPALTLMVADRAPWFVVESVSSQATDVNAQGAAGASSETR